MTNEELMPNSHKFKKEQKEQAEKNITSVVSGKAKTKKKSEVRKFTDGFISEDAHTVKEYIFVDVIIPAIKKTITDIVVNGLDILFYGESGRTRRSSSGSKVSYRSFYEQENGRRRAHEGNRVRAGFDYDDILFDNRGDADAVLTAMEDIMSRYDGIVSVGDLYDLADVSTSNYQVHNYGWSDLHSAKVVRVSDGYILKLPRPMPINNR